MKETINVPKRRYYLLILTLIISTATNVVNIVQPPPKVDIYIHDKTSERK